MSIQSLLEVNRQKMDEKESLDSLARLPQQMIMSMVQRKSIPQTDIPMILARKAELAQEEANKRALMQQAQQQGQQPTIIEKLMAQNAAAEAAKAPAPGDVTEVGIASNPVPEMRMAGGGIVAFEKGGDVEDISEEERERLRQNEYMQRVYGFGDFFSNLGRGIEKYNPFTGTAYRDAIKNFINESPESQAERFRAASPRKEQAASPKQEVAPTTPTTSAVAPRSYKEDDAREVARMQATANVNKRYQDDLEAKRTAVPPIPERTAAKSPEAQLMEEKKGLLDEYRKTIEGEREAAKGAREEAKWMRMLEAGLNIMGGESPYAFSNIGKGAAAASRGYAEDIRGLRAEERDRNKQLAMLGLKEKELGLEGRKLDITEQRYKDLTSLERQKIGILAQRNIDDKMATQVERNFATLMSEYRNSLDKGDVTVSDLYRMAQENVASTRGLKTGLSAPTNTGISYSSFMGKK